MRSPDFIIVGERRCGTTSLAHLLEAHPDVALHGKREMGYFIEEEARHGRKRVPFAHLDADAARWERDHSREDYASRFAGLGEALRIGEKSADYLFWRPAHARIARILPDARFIVTLREPVSRAWSHYWNEVGKGREQLGFEEALAVEGERSRMSAYARNHLSYAARGFYDESLASFFSHVPHGRVLVVTLDEMKRDRHLALARIFEFLGVDPGRWHEPERQARNENWAMVSKPWVRGRVLCTAEQAYDTLIRALARGAVHDKLSRRRMLQSWRRAFREPARGMTMGPATRERLLELYEPHSRALEEMIGRSLADWYQA